MFDKCLGWLLAFMQHLLHSVWSSTVVIGTLRPSLSSGRPYQCMCCSTMCLHCNHSSMVWCCFPCRLRILAFCPPPPTLIAVFISIYLFFLFIDSLLYSCFPLLSHLALVWQCSLGTWCRMFQAGLQAEQANLVFKHLRVQLWFQPPGLPGT